MTVTINGTTGVAVPLGSVSAPGVSNTTSSTTGIYNPTGTTLGIATNGVNAVYVDASQKVGISTTSISTNFRQEIVGAAGSNTGPASSGTTQSTSAVMRIRPGGGFTATLDIGQSGGTGSWLQSTDTTDLSITYPLLLNPVGGNVGIGTSSPVYKLDLNGGSFGTGAITSVGNLNLAISGASDASPCYFYFNSTLAFARNGVGERMRLDSSGNLLVGYTSSNGAYKLQVNSQIFATSATIATSDANYKTNVTPLSDALNLVQKLNPVSFNWKEHPVHNFDTDTPTVGFLAQEVQTALADTGYVNSIVKESEVTLPDDTKEKFLGIAEGNMIALLTKAIQELTAEVTALKAKVGA